MKDVLEEKKNNLYILSYFFKQKKINFKNVYVSLQLQNEKKCFFFHYKFFINSFQKFPKDL